MEWRQTGFTFKVKLLTAQKNLGKSGKTNWVHNALLIAQENLGRQKAK